MIDANPKTARIYKVQILIQQEPPKEPMQRLIKATSQSQAFRFVTNAMVDVNLASQDDLVSLLGHGIKVEDGTKTAE